MGGNATTSRVQTLQAAAAAVLVLAAGALAPPADAAAVPLPARVRLTGRTWPVPDAYLGASVEVSELTTFTRGGAAVDAALDLIRGVGNRPLCASGVALRMWRPGRRGPPRAAGW